MVIQPPCATSLPRAIVTLAEFCIRRESRRLRRPGGCACSIAAPGVRETGARRNLTFARTDVLVMFMSVSSDIPDLPDDDVVLREIAAMDLALARRLYGQAMAETDADRAADITRAYNRVTRSLRQSIALRVKL
eukprot:gene8223-10988_t